MFKNIFKKLFSRSESGPAFDPAQFDDPLALQVEWSPIKKGGANFCTHKLAEAGLNCIEFRSSWMARIFYSIFLLVGLGAMIGFIVRLVMADKISWNMDTLFPIAFGGVFAAVCGCLLWFGTAPIVFDKQRGFFWKGRKAPDQVFDKNSIKYWAELGDVHALQLVREYCSSDDSSYYSYELNLVLEDGRRINVVDHGKLDKLREDAARLAVFLDRPVWDAI